MKQRPFRSLVLALVLFFLFALSAAAQTLPVVRVANQEAAGGTVTVERVASNGPGWIVIHADADGKPGPVIGYAAVADGENSDVTVEIDSAAVTPVLYAMLHVDEGEVGVYEFPGADTPAQVNDVIVVSSFRSQGAATDAALSDVVDTAAANENTSTFVAGLQAAGLLLTLKSDGPFTLFTPTNDAFQSLPDDMLEGWLSDPAGDLRQVLLQHVVPGKVMAADMRAGLEGGAIFQLQTMQGGHLTVTAAGDTLQVNDATIIAADIEAGNGVIHLLSSVILTTTEAATEAETAEAEPAEAETAEAAATPEPTEEATEETAEPDAETQATPEPTQEPVEEAETEAAPEAEAEATPVPAEEAEDAAEPEATPMPAEEAAPEATPVPEEETAENAEPAATAEPAEETMTETTAEAVTADAPAAESKGAAPQTMPATGARVAHGAAPIALVLVVLAVLAGASVVARRFER